MSDKDDVFEYTKEELAYISDEIAAANDENRRIHALFLTVFDSEAGKEVLEAIKSGVCGANATSFDANPIEMARKAGRREVALEIEGILRLAREEAEEEANDNRF